MAQAWVAWVKQQGLEQVVSNIDTELKCFRLKEHRFPLTRNDAQWDNAYTCSPYTAYIRYAEEELDLIPSKAMRVALRASLKTAGLYLKFAQFNRTIQVNNWWVSTHEWPQLNHAEVDWMTRVLSCEYPAHSLMLRGLNEVQNPELIEHLKAQGYQLMPARQVYLFDGENPAHFSKRNNTKNDGRLMRKTDLTLVEPEAITRADFPAIYRCFQALFIEKHSRLNPQFTQVYLEQMWEMGVYEYYGARDSSGEIVAVAAIWQQSSMLSVPILGYRTDLPKTLGLYRLMVAVIFCKKTNFKPLVQTYSDSAPSTHPRLDHLLPSRGKHSPSTPKPVELTEF